MLPSALMGHRATIVKRRALTDRFNQPAGTYVPKLSDVSCRLSNVRGAGLQRTAAVDGVMKADYQLFFEAGIDVTEEDKIASVTDAEGRVMATDLVIMLVKPVSTSGGTLHHIEVLCGKERGPGLG